MDKQAFLNWAKPKVNTLEVDGQIIYLRDLTVGDNNHLIFGRTAYLLEQAKLQGIEVDISDDVLMQAQLKQVRDHYMLARGAAMRICDKEGNLLFDVNNVDDLNQLNGISQRVLQAIYDDSAKKKLPDTP